jgi:hypothetical protein
MKLRLLKEQDLRHAADAMQEKAWRDAIKPTENTNNILFPGWRDDLRREVEKYRQARQEIAVTVEVPE